MQTSRYWIFFQVAPRYVRTPFSNGVRNEGFYGPHYEMGVAHTVGLYGALPKMAHKLVQQSIRNVLRPYCTNI